VVRSSVLVNLQTTTNHRVMTSGLRIPGRRRSILKMITVGLIQPIIESG
jgi:hypothetical protein